MLKSRMENGRRLAQILADQKQIKTTDDFDRAAKSNFVRNDLRSSA